MAWAFGNVNPDSLFNMRKHLPLLPALMGFLPVILAVTDVLGQDIARDRQAVRACDPLYYYGIDCSHLRVTDGEKIPRNQTYRTVYPPAWIGFVEKEMPPDGYIRKALKKNMLIYRQDDIRGISVQSAADMIINRSYSFPADTVVQAVRKYTLSETTGTGLVLIPENFNKPEEQSTTWVVFFDLQSREVLWAVRTKGKCSHMGYTAHWASGIIDGFKRFVKKEYR